MNMNELYIYYYINYDHNFDIDFFKQYISIYISINFKYNKITFKEIEEIEQIVNKNIDTVKNGLEIFTKIHDNDKFINKHNEVWFLYLSNGNIYSNEQLTYNNVDVILLNKNILNKECCYNINKNGELLKFSKNLEKNNKLEIMRVFQNNLNELFTNNYIFKYNNIIIKN